MAKNKRPLMTYEEIMEEHPDFIFADSFTVFAEATPELTLQSQLRRRKRVGNLLKFLQDHGLTRHIICATAPEIPDDLVIYYRDLMPESLEFNRQVVGKWYGRFERNMNADPADVSLLKKYLAQMLTNAGDQGK